MIFKVFYVESNILPSEWKGFEMRRLIGLPNMDRSLYRNNDPATTKARLRVPLDFGILNRK